MSKNTTKRQSTEDFLRIARERFRLADEAEREIRREARTDLNYVAGNQWDEKVRRDREMNGRPALTFNRLPTFVAQVANEARQNRPAIKISPSTDVQKDVADIVRGGVRHIEHASDSDVAYATAIESSLSCGFGYYRVLTQYVSEQTFDQEILIERVEDPFTIYCDPHARRADRADARFYFVSTDIPKDEFREQWPDCETSSTNFFEGTDRNTQGWLNEDSVRVVEYWYIEHTKRKLLGLSNGQSVFEDELLDGKLPKGVKAHRERIVFVPQVKCAKTNGFEILEDEATLGREHPGKWIPIIPVLGREMVVEGKRMLFSLVRFMRDPQQLLNFYKTSMAEVVGMAPRNPYVGVEGQFAGHEDKWRTAATSNRMYLEYKNITVNGTPAAPPQRQSFEPPIQALSVGAMQSSDDMKAGAGMYDASMGKAGNETSGIAIERRKKESDNANFHFLDNLARSQRHCGRIIVDLFGKIYDSSRELLILGEDMKQKVVKVNQEFEDEFGEMKHFDLLQGEYTVTVETGPSYATQREQSFDMMTQFATAYPDLLKIAGDLIFRNSDMPLADKLADRFAKTLPAGLADEKDGQAPIPPAAQQQISQMDQMLQQLTAALKHEQQLRETKQLELDSAERISGQRVKADLIKSFAQISGNEAMRLFEMEVAEINSQRAQSQQQQEGSEPQQQLPEAA
jgi:hypothetical protein